jgi:thiamine kinase-like enzyme
MPPLDLEHLAKVVPGTGVVDVLRLRGGLMNQTYRVVRDGQAYALRIAVPAAGGLDLGLDREWEARVLDRAAAADLAPCLEYSDRGILISRWVAGRSWKLDESRSAANIDRITDLVRRIHALPLPLPARLMSPRRWVDHYAAAADRRGAARVTAALRPAAEQRLAALAALPRVDPVLCHSDLHTLNLIDRGCSLLLLDWEYAHASEPLWDLAGWSANNDFDEDLRRELLASYAGRAPTRSEYSRLTLLSWLYDFVCLSWSELYLQGHTGTAPNAAGQDPEREEVATRAVQLGTRLGTSGRAQQVPAH